MTDTFVLVAGDTMTGALQVTTTGSGFGIAGTDGTLHVHTATAWSVAANTAADDLVVENSAAGGISVLTPDNTDADIRFGGPGANAGARVTWHHDNNLMRLGPTVASSQLAFHTAAFTEAMRIDEEQNLGIGDTDPGNRLHVTDTVNAILILEGTNGGSAVGPVLRLYRNSASPAAGDNLGQILFAGNSSDGAGGTTSLNQGYGLIRLEMVDMDDGTEDSELWFNTVNGGSSTNVRLKIGAGLYTTNATGGDLGADIINAKELYADTKGAIGIQAGDGTFHIHTATCGTQDANANADDLVVENSGAGGISILVPDASDANISFGSPTDPVGARLFWNHDADLLTLGTANANADLALITGSSAEALRINQGGDLQLGGTAHTARLHVTDSANTVMYVESTNTDANLGPNLRLWRNSASPAL